MPKSTTDRNLLFGILALQMDFIARDALIAAMHAWVLEKAKPLGQILLEQKALTADTHALLEALVQKHLALHGNDAEKSLAAVSSVGSVRNDLEQIADPDVQASLIFLPSPSGRGAGGEGQAADPFATAAPPSVGASTSGGMRFRILRPHARGGLGEVFVAHDEELHREVALKEIQNKHADHPESRARFLLEAEITGGLEHPGIVPVYGLGSYADGRPFYAMRFIRGDSLQDAIKRYHQGEPGASATGERTLERRKLLGRLIDVCNALQYAHDRGVLHRDIKPGNIMLGKYGETLVVDWGLAKALGEPGASATGEKAAEAPLQPASSSGSAETIAGTAIGTPAYMSPEQAEGRLDLLGPASDVYSLGATLYTLLTGKTPVEGRTDEVLQKVRTGYIVPPRRFDSTIDAALEAVCVKAMALRPAERYASPRHLADDLEHWLAGEPVTAYREPWMLRFGRWRRRHNTLVTAATLVMATLIASTIIGFGILRREQAQTRVVGHVQGLQDAAAGAVPALLAELASQPALAALPLRTQWEDTALADHQRLRIGLALTNDADVRNRLIGLALKSEDPNEVLLVRDALRPYAVETSAEVWKRVEAGALSRIERFRLLVKLATLDPHGAGWTGSAEPAAEELFAINPLHLGVMQPALSPIREKLMPTLLKAYRSSAPERRLLAAAILADYASDKPQVLADVLMDADEKQFIVLFPKVEAYGTRSLSPLLAEIDKSDLKEVVVLEVKGTISKDDAKVKTKIGSVMPNAEEYAFPAKRHEVYLKAGKNYRVTMESQDIDCYVPLQDRGGKELPFHGGNIGFVGQVGDARLDYKVPTDGTYSVFAASGEGFGEYVLKIVEVAPDNGKEMLGKRQANAAIALLKMNLPEKAWLLLQHSPNPTARSYLIHRFATLGVDVGLVLKRLDEEPDLTARRALILSLGEFSDKDWTPGNRGSALEKLRNIYRTTADPGLHAASEWLLRTSNQEAWLRQINEEWTNDKEQREKRMEEIKRKLAAVKKGTAPQWFVNGQGHTMVVIPAPKEFVMGGGEDFEYKKRIDRTFAIAAKSVTFAQYRQFDKGYQHGAPSGAFDTTGLIPINVIKPDATGPPVVGATWHEAAAYCNWLSKEEGIDPKEWCYVIKDQVVTMKEGYLNLSGYRLPTEAEMEYSARAGAATKWSYGETEELLAKYAWYQKNSQEKRWPVGRLKPNDFGLFDMHGNVWNWCQDRYLTHVSFKLGRASENQEYELFAMDADTRVVRGGSHNYPASSTRSAFRQNPLPLLRWYELGFRVAKTIPP